MCIRDSNTTDAVQWSNITCVNFTANASGINTHHKINLSNLAVQFNMNKTRTLENLSKDAFNYTFNTTFDGSFRVGTVDITAGMNCPQAFTFVDDVYQTSSFREVLMNDNRSALVFASLLEDAKNGYQLGGQDLHDFQMLVAEDGSPGKEAASTYYFYVELE